MYIKRDKILKFIPSKNNSKDNSIKINGIV